MKYLDWLPITKEERTKAAKLDSEGFWSNKNLPVESSNSRPAILPDLSVRHSVSYNKDTLDFSKTLTPNGNTATATASTPPAAVPSDGAERVSGGTQRINPSIAAAVSPSPAPAPRRLPPSRAPSERFDGDFSALGFHFIYLFPRCNLT